MSSSRKVSIGEIWKVSLNDATGHEQQGERPAVVISVHPQTQLAMVVPFTSQRWADRFPYTHTVIRSTTNGLASNSVAMIFQLRCLSLRRFISKMGFVEQKDFSIIQLTIKNYLRL